MSAYPTLAPFVLKRPWLRNLLKPVASWYSNAAGYRQLGLRYETNPPPQRRRRWEGGPRALSLPDLPNCLPPSFAFPREERESTPGARPAC